MIHSLLVYLYKYNLLEFRDHAMAEIQGSCPWLRLRRVWLVARTLVSYKYIVRAASPLSRSGKTLDGPKENWKPSVSIVKAVIKFFTATKKLAHNSESETEGSVEVQRREMENRAAGAAQMY